MNVTYLSARPYLPVRDVTTAIEFFERTLGLQVRSRFGEPPTFAIVGADGAAVTLTLDREGTLAGRATCYLVVEGVDELFERCRAAGADLDSDLAVRHYGMKEFAVHDADGNHVFIGERMG
jgi:uncharacterized glyoxalase superfamily protein PhnB